MDDHASFSQIPATMEDLRCIRPANDDRAQEILVSFNLRQNARIYIAHDQRLRKKPDWLQPYSKLSQSLAVTEAGGERVVYDLFVREVGAGPVVLGHNTEWNAVTRAFRGRFPKSVKMYLVCAEPQ